jgi:rubrerythrin
MSRPVLLRALSESLVLLQLKVLCVVCALTRNYVEAHDLCPCCEEQESYFLM